MIRFIILLVLFIISNLSYAQFSVSGGNIIVSSNATLAQFQTWANNNTSHARVRSNRVVEALKRIKINDGVTFDTSEGTLIINHRLEVRNNSQSNTGIWKVHGGVVIVEGNGNYFSEDWATADFEDATFIIRKGNGAISFWRSEGDSKVKNTKFIVKATGNIDSHLEIKNGGSTGGFLDGFEVHNEVNGSSNFLLLRQTDTDNAKFFNVGLGGWNGLTQTVTFHKNMTLDHTSDIIQFFHRRINDPIFYNVVNRQTGNKIFTLSYEQSGSSGGTGRGIIVGLFSPTVINENSQPIENVEIEIRRVSDGVLEHTGITNANGNVHIDNGNSNDKFKSISWEGRDIYENGNKYIKQAISPLASGVQTSVNQGDFRIRMRHPEYKLVEVTQSFENDIKGENILFSDNLFTVSVSQASSISGINIDPSSSTITISEDKNLQDIYNYYKWWISEEANLNTDQIISVTGNQLNLGAYNLIINEDAKLEASDNFSKILTSGLATIGTDADKADNLFIALTDNTSVYKLIELNNLENANGEIFDFSNPSFPEGETLVNFSNYTGSFRFVTSLSSSQIKIEVNRLGYSNWVINPLDITVNDVFSFRVIQGEAGNPSSIENQNTQLYLLKKILILTEAYRTSYGAIPADLQVTLNNVTNPTAANAENQENQIQLLEQILLRLSAQLEK